jgi:hypothetical protein
MNINNYAQRAVAKVIQKSPEQQPLFWAFFGVQLGSPVTICIIKIL